MLAATCICGRKQVPSSANPAAVDTIAVTSLARK